MSTLSSGARLGAWLDEAAAFSAGSNPTDGPGSRRSADFNPTDGPGSRRSADFNPTDGPGSRRAADFNPTDGPGSRRAADFNPTDIEGQSADAPLRRQVTTFDPPWAFADADALLGQALRRTRAKLARPADRDKTIDPRGRPRPLWRWAPEYRMRATTAGLLSRVLVREGKVWAFDIRGPSGPPSMDPFLLVDVGAVGQGVDRDTQLDKVLRAAVEQEDRFPEVHAQRRDFWPFFESMTGVDLAALPRVAEVLQVADAWTAHVTMALKNQIAANRPVQVSSRVMPMIATPGHGSLPSGHATVAALMSELLMSMLLEGKREHPMAQRLNRLARRIAFNRVVAGVHFPIDSLAGYLLGTQLARLLVALAAPDERTPRPSQLAAADLPRSERGPRIELDDDGDRPQVKFDRASLATDPVLAEMWLQARTDLRESGR